MSYMPRIFNLQKLPFIRPKSKVENIKIKRRDAPLKGHFAPCMGA
jgi:hypothetical protein